MYSIYNSFNEAEKFLCEVLRHESALRPNKIKKQVNSLGIEKCFEICSVNAVSSISAGNLSLAGVKIPHKWKSEYSLTKSRVQFYMDEVDRIAALFFAEGIKLVALKNTGICRGIYRDTGMSPMGDVDVLVKEDDFDRAHLILLANGYELRFRSALEIADVNEAKKNGSAEYYFVSPSGETLWFELQTRPVAGRWIQKSNEPNSDELVSRSIPLPQTRVRILELEDNLLQVCLHTAKHTYVRSPGFRLHTDVDRIVRAGSRVNWDLFVQRASDLKVKTACFFSLYFATEMLGTPIPENVLFKLKPSFLKFFVMVNWLRLVGIFKPEEKKFSSIGYIIFVSLLFDDFQSLWAAIFLPKPDVDSDIKSGWVGVFCFRVNRLRRLIFNRTQT